MHVINKFRDNYGIYKKIRLAIFFSTSFIFSFSYATINAQQAYSKYTNDSASRVLKSAFFVTSGVILKCKSSATCYYIHSDSPLSFVSTDPGRVVIRHEYDYLINNDFDRRLTGSHVNISGNLSLGNSFSNFSVNILSVIGGSVKSGRIFSHYYNSQVIGFGKLYKLTGEIRSGTFEIQPHFKQPYYYIHLNNPVTFDSKGSQGILLRQYDIGININHGGLGYDLKSLIGKNINAEGLVEISVDGNGAPACCSLSVSLEKLPVN